MARKYTYIDGKTKKHLFETTQPNYVSDNEVHKLFKDQTGRDYLLEKSIIECHIRIEN